MNSSLNAIAVKNLTKVYRRKAQGGILARICSGQSTARKEIAGHRALNDVSFDVVRGEAFGVIGKNGSGKSTLLQILSGTLEATQGECKVHGRVAALLELGSGFNPDFTGRENIFINAALHGLARSQVQDRFDRIVEFAEIGEFLDQPVRTYSSGMQMRLAFAVVAHLDADLLLIDEAFAVGDFFFMQKCVRFLAEFCKGGTLILVTHDLSSLQQICQRGLWLEEGQVRWNGPVKELCEKYLADYYRKTGDDADREYSPAPDATALRSPDGCSVRILPGAWKEETFEWSRAAILSVRVLNETVNTGDEVALSIKLRFGVELKSPLLGFHIRNEKGLVILGEMVTWEQSDDCEAGVVLDATVRFALPLLCGGAYSFSCAIASGTLQSHVQHHLVHDALLWEVASGEGDFGIVRTAANCSCSVATHSNDDD